MISDKKVAKKYLSLSKSAEDRGLKFDLSLTSVRNILNAKRCYYTGVDISLDLEQGHPRQLTFDRKDASKGYVKGNVVACSYKFNQKKGSLSIKDVEILSKKLL